MDVHTVRLLSANMSRRKSTIVVQQKSHRVNGALEYSELNVSLIIGSIYRPTARRLLLAVASLYPNQDKLFVILLLFAANAR